VFAVFPFIPSDATELQNQNAALICAVPESLVEGVVEEPKLKQQATGNLE